MAGSEPEHPPLWGAPNEVKAPEPPYPRGGYWFRWGLAWGSLALFILGGAPLVIYLWIDPTANPVGPGILAMLTAWPSIIGGLVGLAWGIHRTWGFKRP